MRTCAKCKVEKPLEEFVSDRRNPSGKGYACKECEKKRDWRNKGQRHNRPARREGVADLRILSLGGGVQSSTLFYMAIHGEIDPFDAVIFADTGWEPTDVYAWVERLEQEANALHVPFYRVGKSNLATDQIESGKISIPAYNGTMRYQRTCTSNYKIRPIRRQIVQLLGGRSNGKLVDQVIGISWDEIERMSDSDVLYLRNTYPLIDLRMTRDDCKAWMEDHGYAEPPRSSCVGCPFRGVHEWRLEKEAQSEIWIESIRFEETLRAQPGLEQFTLRQSRIPLRLDDLVEDPDGTECKGFCMT